MRNCRLGSLGSLRELAKVPHAVLSLARSRARGVGATTPDRNQEDRTREDGGGLSWTHALSGVHESNSLKGLL